jgi:hypothetical protein
MPKVLCSLPNASTEIGGVQFTKHANGMLSEDVSAEVAARFAAIRGYTVVGAPDADTDAEKAAAEAEKAALLERAEAIHFKAKSTWGIGRLRNEVEAAEKAAAEAAAAK